MFRKHGRKTACLMDRIMLEKFNHAWYGFWLLFSYTGSRLRVEIICSYLRSGLM